MLRLTSARQTVLDILRQDCRHWSAQDIHALASERLPSINLSTVYRALEYLCKAGLVSISDIGCGCPVYEAVSQEKHHHLVCQGCGQIAHLPDETIAAFFAQVQSAHAYRVTTNHLVLFGLCQKCNQASPESGLEAIE